MGDTYTKIIDEAKMIWSVRYFAVAVLLTASPLWLLHWLLHGAVAGAVALTDAGAVAGAIALDVAGAVKLAVAVAVVTRPPRSLMRPR